jgi:PAS domain S-box-containing protein
MPVYGDVPVYAGVACAICLRVQSDVVMAQTDRIASILRSQLPKARLRLIALQRLRSSPPPDGHASTLPDALEELERAFDELDVMCSHSRELLEHRARLEADQERTRRRYQALFDGAPEPYIMTDLDGIILEVNTAASDLLHVSPRWLRSKPLDLYVEDRRQFAEALARLAGIYVFGEPMSLTIRPRERARVSVEARVKRFEGDSGRAELWWVLQPTTARSSV